MSTPRQLVIVALLILLSALVSHAQDTTTPPVIEPIATISTDASIAISFPPPVYTIRGSITIVGTVDTPTLESYRVEFRPLEFPITEVTDAATTPTTQAERPWFPATLPRNQAVRNAPLGTWNTTTTRDGLYELRLLVNETGGNTQIFRLSPLRVENTPSEFALLMLGDMSNAASRSSPGLAPTPTQLGNPQISVTLAPTPTALNSGTPTLTATVDANVRRGDSTAYETIGSLLAGEEAAVIGISTSGSGWYYVELNSGRRGFIAPSIVRFSGNISDLQRINPPLPPTPTPTPTPVTQANLVISGLRLDPAQPDCGESFDIFINVTNNGTGPSSSSGTMSIIDRHVRTGSQQGSTVGGFPVINPGGNFVVAAALTINTFFDEDHDVVVTLDPDNLIPETNEGDNVRSIRYNLDQADCG